MLWPVYLLVFLYGLAHTPILVDILRQLFPHWNIHRVTSSISSCLLILLLTLFYLLGLGMQVFVFIPLMPQVPHRSVKLVIHSLFAYWVWINAVVNYMHVIFSRPGIFGLALSSSDPTSESSEGGNEPPNLEENTSIVLAQNGIKSKKWHCKICQASIPYRDHHCPFTGNCIGLSNYANFYLWLLYSMLGLLYSVSVAFVYFGECFLPWGVPEGELCSNIEPYSEMVLPTIGGSVTVTLMFICHTLLLLADISTYDILKNWSKIKFNLTKFRAHNSRLRTLLLTQRTHLLWFLLPIKNRKK